MGSTPRTRSKIPDFDSIKDEAAFWDTHSTAEFEDEWEPVDWEIGEVRSHFYLRAEVDRATLRRVRDLAREQGITSDELVRRWIMAGLGRTADVAEGAAPASATD